MSSQAAASSWVGNFQQLEQPKLASPMKAGSEESTASTSRNRRALELQAWCSGTLFLAPKPLGNGLGVNIWLHYALARLHPRGTEQ